MAYRRSSVIEERLTASREGLLDAALELVAEGGYAACTVDGVARRAGVATGTVYRHFGAKSALVAEVFRRATERELAAVAGAAAGDGPAVRRIATAVEVFARRALRSPRLAYALIAEPVDLAVDAERLVFRRAYRDLLAAALADGVRTRELPPQDATLTAACLVGAIAEALLGPLAADPASDHHVRGLVETCTRAMGATRDRHRPVVPNDP